MMQCVCLHLLHRVSWSTLHRFKVRSSHSSSPKAGAHILKSAACMQVDVCKLMQTFPRGMSACVRESFARMDAMDPLLRSRLSRWLAYHLSNFDFMWPWDKWKHVLAAPAHDSQRCRTLATATEPSTAAEMCECM